MDSFANISQKIIEFTTLPYVQEIKKTGVFAFLMAGAQATSSAILVNTIPSQNFYQFFYRSTFISSCLGGMQASMKNSTRLVGLCNKVSGMRKLHNFASTYINCKGTPAMEFFYEFR